MNSVSFRQTIVFKQAPVDITAAPSHHQLIAPAHFGSLKTSNEPKPGTSPRHVQSPVDDQPDSSQAEIAACHRLLQQITDMIQACDQRRKQNLLELQQVAIELAIAAASHLVETTIDRDQSGIEDLVKSAVNKFDESESITVSLNPDDLELLERRLAVTTHHAQLRTLSIQADTNLARGSCQLKNGTDEVYITEISHRIAQIRKHWLEELDDSQVERRQAQGGHSSLRRFPDRRETA